jgi:HD-GYP domain-containing protein (c-di-GMP phosphodiesterase class II)
MTDNPTDSQRWNARPLQAFAVRAFVLIAPLAGSFAFVHFASTWIKPPLSSLWLYLAWWFGLSGAATAVLFGVDRVARRLLPLSALLKLSLVFPDETPSRLKTALSSGRVDTLERRLALVQEAKAADTPAESARRLLELVAALNVHDTLTRGHSERVRAYSVLIGQSLGLHGKDLDLLNWAALLHDIGKLEVPQEILTKDRRPSDAEWETIRRHPLFGEDLTAPLEEWLESWRDAIGYHHERWDGTGYPRGLGGEEIPLAGRIVAVADAFDVITSAPRPRG